VSQLPVVDFRVMERALLREILRETDLSPAEFTQIRKR